MNSMIGVTGGEFRVEGSFQREKGNRRSTAMRILSEIASILRQDGYEITKVRRSRHDSVKALCILGDDLGIDLFVSPREIEEDGSVFVLGGFG